MWFPLMLDYIHVLICTDTYSKLAELECTSNSFQMTLISWDQGGSTRF